MYIFWIGYQKIKTQALLITAVAFTLFFVKAAAISLEMFFDDNGSWFLNDEFWLAVAAILDLIIIGLIAFSFSSRFMPEESSPTIDANGTNNENGGEDDQETGITKKISEEKENENVDESLTKPDRS